MIEQTILSSLLYNEAYVRRALPHLKTEYFEEPQHAEVFNLINTFVNKYQNPPTQDELRVELSQKDGLSQEVYEKSLDLLNSMTKRSKEPALDWLLEQSEKFCQDRALYNAIVESVAIVEGDSGNITKSAIPDLMKTALSVSFDHAIGHDFRDYKARYKTLRENTEYKIPFDVDIFNTATDGGLPRKTLNVISAMTGAGKTLFMCHYAARAFLAGLRVLYITLEMAEERISERIEANILGVSLNDLAKMSALEYDKRMDRVMNTCDGRLIVKEYPTASAGVSQFRALLNELRLKKDFTPDLIIVDYINICSSSRYKVGAVNSYSYVKAICEELRGLAIEFNVPIISATQLNRSAVDTSDVGLGEISESHGLAMTVDLLWAMIRSEELDDQNLVMFKQLKNRYADMSSMLRFVVGIDRGKMRLFDSDQESITMNRDGIVSNGSPPPNANESVSLSSGVRGQKSRNFSGLH